MGNPVTRHFGLDWLRIGAFGLLIFYHIGMFFVPWPWHVKTAQPMDWVAMPMLGTASWRLDLLFIVSGFASATLLAASGSTGRFMAERSRRLLIPLAFGMIIILPPQPWVELVFHHDYRHDLPWFWRNDYYRVKSISGVIVPTWNHLWFVAYLWVYTLALALVLQLPAELKARAALGFGRLVDGWGILALPILWLLFVQLGPGRGQPSTHALIDDLTGHLRYFPGFLFGVGLAGARQGLAAAAARWPVAALLAASGYALVLWVEVQWPGNRAAPPPYADVMRLGAAVQGGAAIVALLGLADRFLQRDHPWRSTLTEAVFPFYIVHQTIIVWLGWWLLRFHLSAVAELLLLLIATVAGCLAFYVFGRRIRWLRPLIGLKPS